MTAHHRHQVVALRCNFELALLTAMLVISADLCWLAHDVVANGWNAYYVLVFSGLMGGLIFTFMILLQHNCRIVKRLDRITGGQQ